MARITVAELQIQFNFFCNAYALPHPAIGAHARNGQYYLEQPFRGQFRVSRVSDTGTGEANAFGNSLRSASEMHACLYFAISVRGELPAPLVTVGLTGGLLEVIAKPAGVQLHIHDYDSADPDGCEYTESNAADEFREDSAGQYRQTEYAADVRIVCDTVVP